MKLSELAGTPSAGYEGVMRRLVRVDTTGVGVKDVFDHVTNYAICAGILVVAGHLAKTGDPLGAVLAVLLLLLFVALLAINIVHGLVLASAIGITRWAGFLLAVLMIFVIAQLAVVPGLLLK